MGKVLADAGVDAIELGFPCSDPGMGGPTSARPSRPSSAALHLRPRRVDADLVTCPDESG